MNEFRYEFNQINGLTIQAAIFEYRENIDGEEQGLVEIRIPYDAAYKMITQMAEQMGLIDHQKQKLKKLMQFLLEVL